MRVFTAIALAIFLLVISVGVVAAEDSSNSSIRESLSEKREDKIEKFKEKREEIKEKVASKAAQVREKRKTKVKEIFNKILNHLKSANNRLSKISDKIQTRLDKIKAKGIDTTAWQASLDNCKQSKSGVEAAIANAKSKIDTIDPQTSENNTQVKDAREAIVATRKELHNYRKCLVDVMSQLKSASELREASESAN